MKKILFFVMIAGMFITGTEATYSQFSQNSSRSLFSDVKAYQVGDVITILIIEDTQADNDASTSETRDSDLSGGVGVSSGSSGFNAEAELGTGNGFKAEGNNTRNERIRSKLSARITEIDDVGNLIIDGKRTTKVNGETQLITLKGIVRPIDIRPDNSVLSYNIMELNLVIEGDGNISEIQEPGLITKFLRLLF